MRLSAEEACEDNLDPQLDQGNEEVIRVVLLTFDLIINSRIIRD